MSRDESRPLNDKKRPDRPRRHKPAAKAAPKRRAPAAARSGPPEPREQGPQRIAKLLARAGVTDLRVLDASQPAMVFFKGKTGDAHIGA